MADSNSHILSTLSSIETMAKHLSEPHLLPQYADESQKLVLTNFINSAFRNLEQCVGILRPRSPTSRLPKEILGLIFQAAQDEDWERPFRLTRNTPISDRVSRTKQETLSPYIPLVLSQVSQLWRDVSINLPTLWASVKICSSWQHQSIETTFSRSKSLPIDLQIMDCFEPVNDFGDSDDEFVQQENTQTLCGILVLHLNRCRSISVYADFDSSYLYKEMLDAFKLFNAPLLKTLSIVSHAGQTEYDPRFLFSSAPLLSDVRLNLHALFSGHPPLDRVTSLYLTGRPVTSFAASDFFDVLSECPVLEELYLYNEVVDDWSGDEVRDHSMPALHSIHFYGVTRTTRSEVLRSLVAPSLDHILFAPFSHQETFAQDYFDAHGPVTDQFPSLRTISVLVNDVSGDWFGDVGDLFPDIERLIMAGSFGGLVSEKLTGDEYDDFMLNLRSLSFQNITKGAEDDLRTFISCRYAIGMRPPTIYLNPTSLTNMHRLEWLERRAEIIPDDDLWRGSLGASKVVGNPGFSYDVGLPS